MRGPALAGVLTAAALAAPAPASAAVEIVQFQARPLVSHALPRAAVRLEGRLRGLGLAPRRFSRLPMLLVSGTPAELDAAGRLPGVLYAHRVGRRVHFLLDKSVPVVYHGDPSPIRAETGDGAGVRVAIIDTGIDATHPGLADRVVKNVALVGHDSVGGASPSVATAVECPAPCDTDTEPGDGHGTHVAGIVAGAGDETGRFRGVSSAGLVGISVTRTGLTTDWLTLAGFDYVLAHPELNIKVVNNSWTIGASRFDPTAPLHQATKMLHDAGITVVWAAGNGGPGNAAPGQPTGSSNCIDGADADCTLNIEGAAPWDVLVAGGSEIVAGSAPGDQDLYTDSSRGDPRSNTVGGVKVSYLPTLTAPATFIVSAAASTEAIRCVGPNCREANFPTYAPKAGTSMAAPHVAGAVAVLQSAAKKRFGAYLTPDQIKQLLIEGAAPMTHPFGEPVGCSFAEHTLYGCDQGPCPNDPGPALVECDARTEARPYLPFEVGAGYLDIRGSLAALDRLGG